MHCSQAGRASHSDVAWPAVCGLLTQQLCSRLCYCPRFCAPMLLTPLSCRQRSDLALESRATSRPSHGNPTKIEEEEYSSNIFLSRH